MHTNHRRRNKFRAKHHGLRRISALTVYSLAAYKILASRKVRARERDLMRHELYDALPDKVRRDILWHYW